MKYKINNLTIDAESPVKALEISKAFNKHKEEMKDLDLNHYQEWVDYDMKKYGEISEETMKKIREAGLSVTKDQYGQYEVIAKDSVKDESILTKNDVDEMYKTVQKHWNNCLRKDNEAAAKLSSVLNELKGLYGRNTADSVKDATDFRKALSGWEKDWYTVRDKFLSRLSKQEINNININELAKYLEEVDIGNMDTARRLMENIKMHMGDSVKDDDLSDLTEEEIQAIDDYKKAISNTNDPKLLDLFSHILREEIEHKKELEEADKELVKDASEYKVEFVNSVDKTAYTIVVANSEDEARKKAKSDLGRECYRIIRVRKI